MSANTDAAQPVEGACVRSDRMGESESVRRYSKRLIAWNISSVAANSYFNRE